MLICNFLARLLVPSIGIDLASQVDNIIKLTREAPSVVVPLIYYSGDQFKIVDRLRLASALFTLAMRHAPVLGADILDDKTALGASLLTVTSYLISSINFNLKKSSPKKDDDDLSSFFESQFNPKQFLQFVANADVLVSVPSTNAGLFCRAAINVM